MSSIGTLTVVIAVESWSDRRHLVSVDGIVVMEQLDLLCHLAGGIVWGIVTVNALAINAPVMNQTFEHGVRA